MPYIETASELADEICNWIGVYEKVSCACDSGSTCSRMEFATCLATRIRAVAKNERTLNLSHGEPGGKERWS